jgi:hypothetical protein
MTISAPSKGKLKNSPPKSERRGALRPSATWNAVRDSPFGGIKESGHGSEELPKS